MKTKLLVLLAALFCGSALLAQTPDFQPVYIEPRFPSHCQGICCDDEFIYISFTTAIIKVDYQGQLQAETAIPTHAGDLCLVEDKIYIAQALRGEKTGGFAVVMDKNLQLLQNIPLSHSPKPGCITYLDGCFYLDNDTFGKAHHPINHVHKYSREFKFLQSYEVAIGDTQYGAQTITAQQGSLWMGYYSKTRLVQTDPELKVLAKFSQPYCAEGLCTAPPRLASSNPRFLIASNRNRKDEQDRRLFGTLITLHEFRDGEFVVLP